eukprot:6094326-Pyramimonas_sp.AAC.1
MAVLSLGTCAERASTPGRKHFDSVGNEHGVLLLASAASNRKRSRAMRQPAPISHRNRRHTGFANQVVGGEVG